MSATNRLVFKLYGNFHWPLTADNPEPLGKNEEPDRKTGVVEVRYAITGAKPPYRAYLIWIPEGTSPQSTEPPLPGALSIHQLLNPLDWFTNPATATTPIWIDGKPRKGRDKLVSFCGAHLFEQYTPQGDGSTLELRWPLVPEYHRNTLHIYSSLILTAIQDDGGVSLIHLELSLPMPVRHSDAGKWTALPLRVAYRTKANKPDELGRIDALVGRGVKNGSEQSFIITTPGDDRLGALDLAAAHDALGKGCAAYSLKGSLTSDLKYYWPNVNAIAADLLGTAGLSPTNGATSRQPKSLVDAHLHLPANGDKAPSLNYRACADTLTLNALLDAQAPLSIPNKVYVDISLTWSIQEEHLQSPEKWTSTVNFRLSWSETLSKGNFAANNGFAEGLLEATATRARKTREGLPLIEGLQPASLLPELSVAQGRTVAFALYSQDFAAIFQPGSAQSVSWGSISPAYLRLTLAVADTGLPKVLTSHIPADNTLPLKAGLPGFGNDNTEVTLSLAQDASWASQQANSGLSGSPYFASFGLISVCLTQAQSARLGSLVFDLTTQELSESTSVLRTAGRAIGGMQGWRYAAGKQHLNAMICLTLPASRVDPISTDVARSDRSGRPAPLLIPFQGSTLETQGDVLTANSAYQLYATETFGSDEDRLLTVSLRDTAEVSGERDYLLLAEQPYSVLRFRQTPLGARGTDGTTEVAIYSSDDRLWQYRIVAPLYHFMLPPQAIGESADKPNRLELHDLPYGSDEHPPRPFTAQTGKALRLRAVDFRLTPSTDLWVRPSDVVRGYFIPEQASYELFRQRGEYGLGAALAALRSEFLYGLSVSVDTSAERSVARFARVAEISSLTGNIVGPPRERNDEQPIAIRWNQLSYAIARRPERLELWARDPDAPVDFAPARFVDSARFALRGTALHCPPVVEPDLPQTAEPMPPAQAGQLRFHSQGLRGGALWPIESLNLLNALKARTISQGGMLERVALAPFGGDAMQKAEFLNGIVRIISETRNGCVERQKIEVLGRIGALWHRAKHVVVYERTVNPSAQFAPEFDNDDRTRSRRPILRKVSEYVELLQPERLYPDFPQASVRTTGFLDRVRFNSKIINVDSAWGSDVGKFGWRVPLWNRAAARMRPQVYGMPDIAFVTVAEGDGENPLVAQECQDTELLYFFADFKATTSDTDLWLARLDIDFANLPQATTLSRATAGIGASRSDDSGNARRPAPGRFLPGARRFTWRLAPAAQKTAINAGRANTPIYVGLESVSFMRADFSQADPSAFTPLQTLLKTTRNLKKLDHIGIWSSTSTPSAQDAKVIQDFEDLVGNVAANNMPPSDNAFKESWESFRRSFTDALMKQANDLKTAVEDKTSGASLLDQLAPGQGTTGCQAIQDRAAGQLRGKSLLVLAALQDWQKEAEMVFGRLPIGKGDLINWLIEEIRRKLKPVFNAASNDVGDVQAGVETARAILRSLDVDVQDLFARAHARLNQLTLAYDRSKPWSNQRLLSFRADFRNAASNLADDVRGAIDEARQRLSVELGDFAQGIASQLGRALALIADSETQALNDLGLLKVAIRRQLAEFMTALDGLATADLPVAIEAARKAIEDSDLGKDPARDPTGKEPAMKQAALDALNALEQQPQQLRAKIDSALQQLMATPEEDIDRLAGHIHSLASGATDLVTALAEVHASLDLQARQLSNAGFAVLGQNVEACWPSIDGAFTTVERLGSTVLVSLEKTFATLDFCIDQMFDQMSSALDALQPRMHAMEEALDDAAANIGDALKEFTPEELLGPVIIDKVVKPALEELLASFPKSIGDDWKKQLAATITDIPGRVSDRLETLDQQALAVSRNATDLCRQLYGGLDATAEKLRGLTDAAGDLRARFEAQLEGARKKLEDVINSGANVQQAAAEFGRAVRNVQNDLSATAEAAQAYGDRVLDAAGKLAAGNLMAKASNVLKLYSAVTSAPELAGLKSDIERIRADFDELSDIIETTRAGAMLNRLGDELKALGISFPYDRICDRLLPASLQGVDLGKVFANIGGASLVKMFKGASLSDSVRDAIRLTHDFDRQHARAWVQVDIDAPLPGRHTLFSIGPFQCDFVDLRILGQMRAEASKDSDEVTQTGYGRLGGTLDMVVSGQSMVRFEKFAIGFTRENGLKIDFDPNNIRLNPSFQFVQDALLGLFPDAVGPMTVIKDNGIPIGLEHEYALPVISANAVTSGISNISIENRLRLLAYPDFILADRFSLSRPERPFIFSLFILGGTGFVQIEAEYRPFDSELTVTVDAAAGGSALLGISAGPFSGQVYITLSAVLGYRKTIGRPGGGLSVSALLVIAGSVDVMGIATVGIYVTLRLTYRDNGQVDADGTLSVTIKISRFFSITARAGVQYRLRDGHAQTRTSSSLDVNTDPELKRIANKATQEARKIQGATI